jgi:uncharacterized membrane protein
MTPGWFVIFYFKKNLKLGIGFLASIFSTLFMQCCMVLKVPSYHWYSVRQGKMLAFILQIKLRLETRGTDSYI